MEITNTLFTIVWVCGVSYENVEVFIIPVTWKALTNWISLYQCCKIMEGPALEERHTPTAKPVPGSTSVWPQWLPCLFALLFCETFLCRAASPAISEHYISNIIHYSLVATWSSDWLETSSGPEHIPFNSFFSNPELLYILNCIFESIVTTIQRTRKHEA